MNIVTYSRLNFYHLWIKNLRKYSTKSQESEKWYPVIGLEIHAQIDTESKLFSGASTRFGAPVNSCVSLFDCATPGTLPVLNKKCVEAGVLTALALRCRLNEVSLFDRKHYFYADLPAGYQITQQRQPLAIDGELQFLVHHPLVHKEPYYKRSKIKQIQLEQDSGKSIYDQYADTSLIDLNRAGVPLMELVFEPDLSDAEEAAGLVKELMNILEILETCSCKMEEGALRVDANISVHKPNEPLGVRTEVKNISSVRSVANAIKYEINRQIRILSEGKQVENETLTWDATKNRTISLRDKEEKQDYRFMPEPNLPPLRLNLKDNENKKNIINVSNIVKKIPQLPEEIRQNFITKYGLTILTAMTLINDSALARLFEEVMSENSKRDPIYVANRIVQDLLEVLNKYEIEPGNMSMTSKQLGEIIDLLEDQTINLSIAKNVMEMMLNKPAKVSAAQIVAENNWTQINDDEELRKLILQVIDENPKLVAQLKRGKVKAFYSIGRNVTKKAGGRNNLKKTSAILREILDFKHQTDT